MFKTINMFELQQTCHHCQFYSEIKIDFSNVSRELHIGVYTSLRRGFKIMHKATGRKTFKACQVSTTNFTEKTVKMKWVEVCEYILYV